MGDMLNTAVSGLMAFQQELDTTSNNISNANTPGYSRETTDLVSVPGPYIGALSIGDGVQVSSVQRVYDQTVASQVVSATSAYNQLNSFSTQAAEVDNLLGSTSNGLSSQLQSLASALQTVANAPTSSASRQAFLSQAQQLVSDLQSDDSSLQSLGSQANTQLTSDASQVTSLAQSIATLNKQIMADTSKSTQAPNSLLDQRDQLINQLATYVNVTTSQQSDGSINVYIGSGQTLVTGTSAASLTTIQNAYDPSQDDLGLSSPAGAIDVTQQISGGTLGGTLQFRSQMLAPARNSLGQIAVVLSNAMNAQNQAGLDQSGNLGGAIFSVGAPSVLPDSANTGNATVSATVSNANAITTDNYILRYDGTNWTLSNASSRWQRDHDRQWQRRQPVRGRRPVAGGRCRRPEQRPPGRSRRPGRAGLVEDRPDARGRVLQVRTGVPGQREQPVEVEHVAGVPGYRQVAVFQRADTH